MENLSNHSVLRTKFLITFSRNGLRILAEKSLKSKLGAPEITHEEESKAGEQPKPVSKSSTDNRIRIWIDIRISNGLHLSPKNLSYQDLVRMVEKLEGLC